MNCFNCNETLQSNQKFCHSCGEKLPEQKGCYRCEQPLDRGQKFCHSCGLRVMSINGDNTLNGRTEKERYYINKVLVYLDKVSYGDRVLETHQSEKITHRISKIISSDTTQTNYEAACLAMAKLCFLEENYEGAIRYLEKLAESGDDYISRESESLLNEIDEILPGGNQDSEYINIDNENTVLTTSEQPAAPDEVYKNIEGSNNNSTVLDILKSTTGAVVWLFFVVLSLIILGVFIQGVGYLGNIVLPFVSSLVWPIIVFTILFLLPLLVFHSTRGWAATGMFLSSYIYGFTAWLLGFLATLHLWGVIAVILGLFMFGVGVVPLGVLATLFNGEWSVLLNLILLTGLMFVSRFVSFSIIER